MFNDFLTIPADCTTAYNLPALPADPNCILAPKLSQVNYVFISPCSAAEPFENDGSDAITLVSPAEIDNANTDNTKSRQILGEGGIAEHEVVEVDGPNRTTLIPNGGRGYELQHRIIISDQSVYDFLKALQAGWVDFRFWYQDLAGLLYGEVVTAAVAATRYGGIRPSYVNVQFPKGEGRDDRGYATLILRWNANAEPHRYTSPVTVADSCAP